MNKLLLVGILVMLCIANTSAARFLEDTNANQSKLDQSEGIDNSAEQTSNPETTLIEKDVENVIIPPNPDNLPIVDKKPEDKSETQNEPIVEDKKDEPVVKKEEEIVEKEKKDEVPTVIVVPNENEGENKVDSENKQENKQEEQKEKEVEEVIPAISNEKKESSYFGLSIGFCLILAAGILFFFVGFYRYSLRKYKIPPFTPPNFCPNFLFPRPENDLLMEDYCIQSSTEMGGVYSSEKYHNFY